MKMKWFCNYLKVFVSRADVIARAKNAFEDQRKCQRVKDAEMLQEKK